MPNPAEISCARVGKYLGEALPLRGGEEVEGSIGEGDWEGGQCLGCKSTH